MNRESIGTRFPSFTRFLFDPLECAPSLGADFCHGHSPRPKGIQPLERQVRRHGMGALVSRGRYNDLIARRAGSLAESSECAVIDRGMPTASQGASVVIPTYNEAPNLPRLLPKVARWLRHVGVPYEIILVDDGSPDGTAEIAQSLAARLSLSLHVLRRPRRAGLASAVLEGVRRATYSSIAVMDGDLSHDPADLPGLIRPVLDERADLVVGSRFASGAQVGPRSVFRQTLSALGVLCVRPLTQVRDPLSGFFASRRELFDTAYLAANPRGYKILLDLLARVPGARVEEVPVSFVDRRTGESKLSLRQGIEFAYQVLELWRLKITPSRKRGDSISSSKRLDLDGKEQQLSRREGAESRRRKVTRDVCECLPMGALERRGP